MLLVRGDLVSFEMSDGEIVKVPDDFGLVHDVDGTVCDVCTLYVCPYTLTSQPSHDIQSRIENPALEYFGEGADIHEGCVAIPKGPWQYVGVVKQIFYARYGELQAHYYHPYSDNAPTVELYRQRRGKCFKLQLPDGCVVNERGFVWP